MVKTGKPFLLALLVFACIGVSINSIAQNNLFKTADSLEKVGLHRTFVKELYTLEKNPALRNNPEDHLKLYVKLMEYYRLIRFEPDSITKYYQILPNW